MTHLAIIGAGSWGTALAIVAARAQHDVSLWSRDPSVVNSINNQRHNPRHLSFAKIPEQVTATASLDESVREADLVFLATPSHAARQLLAAVKPYLRNSETIVSVAKGIEIDSGKRISQVVNEVLGESFFEKFVCLSGPSFAKEVVESHPTAIVAASRTAEAAQMVQSELSSESLRIYTNSDVVGTELAGSVKNVMAIAAGMTKGLGYGSNSIAALITRGIAEMTRLAMTQGGQLETLMGLAGLGDLVLTCTGTLSRNRFVGEELGKGRSLDEIVSSMNEVAEGIKTSRAVQRLAKEAGIEMPITNEVAAVLYEGKTAREAVVNLMTRPLRSET